MSVLNRIRNSVLLKETATLASGNILAQCITIVSYFLLTRLYSPEDFGLFNVFFSYIELFIIVSTGKYELSLVVASDEKEAAALASFTLRLNALVCSVLLALISVLWLLGLLPPSFEKLGFVVLFIPLLVFFCGTSRVYSFLFNRYHAYRKIALSENVNASASLLFKSVFGLFHFCSIGLPIGAVLGQASANLCYRLSLHKLPLPRASSAARRLAARKHAVFPKFVATKDFLNTFSANLPFLMGAAYFEKAEIGLFAIALTFTRTPVLLLCSVFERVLYARCSEAVRSQQRLWKLISRFCLTLFAVALPVAILGWFVAEPLISFGFGHRWTGCTPFVHAVLPWALLTLLSNSLMFVSNIFRTQHIEFGFYAVQLLLRIAALAVGIYREDFLLAVWLFSAVSAVTSFSLLLWYLWQVRRYDVRV